MKWLLLLCSCFVMPLALGGETATSQSVAGPSSASSNVVELKIGNFKFMPEVITVAAGTRLSWVNQDDAPHLVTGTDPGSPIKSPALDTDDKYSVVLTKPGTYRYFCSLHPQMTGTIIVH